MGYRIAPLPRYASDTGMTHFTSLPPTVSVADLQLDSRQLCVTASTMITLPAATAEWFRTHLAQWFKHLDPENTTPLSRYAWQMTVESPDSKCPGTLTILLPGGSLNTDVEWQLVSISPRAAAGSSDEATVMSELVCMGILTLRTRIEAVAAHKALTPAQASPGSDDRTSTTSESGTPVAASLQLPGIGAPVANPAHIVQCIDALDLVELDGDSGGAIARQRADYAGIPTVIEAWGRMDFTSRTWIMLKEDVIAKFGSVDHDAVAALIAPDLQVGRTPHVAERDNLVLVNEV
jgi:hypothetical protein